MFRNRSVNLHSFAMVPSADIPRSSFRMQKSLKTTFDAGYLVPVFCEEVLPGDTWNLGMSSFARLATPLFPIMDNAYLDSFFFFVPNRLVWENWERFCGAQDNPDDPIDFIIPICESPASGYAVGSLQDYFGLPTVGQIATDETFTHSSLPLRGYNLIWNEWFRDQNLQDSVPVDLGDTQDPPADYVLLRRGKRHDYFTSCLPWPEKGGVAVTIPLGGRIPVLPADVVQPSVDNVPLFRTNSVATPVAMVPASGAIAANIQTSVASSAEALQWTNVTGLVGDLSEATQVTINQLREGFQVQRLLERDARGGTRYVEILKSHFGVMSPDARLQRPEYLGGGSTRIGVFPVPQTSATSASGTDTPQGNLSATGHVVSQHGFTHSFVEHGYVIGLVNVRADLTYQQGLRRHWTRATRYDFYWPAFAMLGEQAVLNQEIWCRGLDSDLQVFGYQERWGEMRYLQSEITGQFRSTFTTPLDGWHLAQEFASLPVLGNTFIQENPPFDRIIAVGTEANGQQFIMDAMFEIQAARAMPMYSVPGHIDHF